uniref:Dynein axonemal assembly factor 1 homolog n=1 Tax=Clastoptera arizonana TaxID=38151 RepID=A0A1B6DVQ0_9HEMI
MDKLEAIVRTDIEPNVIDMKMIEEAIKDQSPKGQAGILIEQDGYDLKEIHYIRLEFLNILKIDHLWILPGLTKLQLGNNIIKKIENLDSLINLKELDLSFNNITVIENLEELTTYFERNLGDIVNTFIENVQGFFTQLREYENSFSEVITDQALRFLVHLTIRNEDVLLPPPLKAIMVDKETINNSLAASHDLHLLIIDNREDLLVSQIRSWHQTLCAEFLHNEISRNRTAVMEINHFSDFQREEFEQYQKSLDIEELYTRIPNPPL